MEIEPKEVIKLIHLDESFPFHELAIDTEKEDDGSDIDAKLTTFLDRGGLFIQQALQKHRLFKEILPGNPCIIIRYAHLYANPHSGLNSLVDIYLRAQK